MKVVIVAYVLPLEVSNLAAVLYAQTCQVWARGHLCQRSSVCACATSAGYASVVVCVLVGVIGV